MTIVDIIELAILPLAGSIGVGRQFRNASNLSLLAIDVISIEAQTAQDGSGCGAEEDKEVVTPSVIRHKVFKILQRFQ